MSKKFCDICKWPLWEIKTEISKSKKEFACLGCCTHYEVTKKNKKIIRELTEEEIDSIEDIVMRTRS